MKVQFSLSLDWIEDGLQFPKGSLLHFEGGQRWVTVIAEIPDPEYDAPRRIIPTMAKSETGTRFDKWGKPTDGE